MYKNIEEIAQDLSDFAADLKTSGELDHASFSSDFIQNLEDLKDTITGWQHTTEEIAGDYLHAFDVQHMPPEEKRDFFNVAGAAVTGSMNTDATYGNLNLTSFTDVIDKVQNIIDEASGLNIGKDGIEAFQSCADRASDLASSFTESGSENLDPSHREDLQKMADKLNDRITANLNGLSDKIKEKLCFDSEYAPFHKEDGQYVANNPWKIDNDGILKGPFGISPDGTISGHIEGMDESQLKADLDKWQTALNSIDGEVKLSDSDISKIVYSFSKEEGNNKELDQDHIDALSKFVKVISEEIYHTEFPDQEAFDEDMKKTFKNAFNDQTTTDGMRDNAEKGEKDSDNNDNPEGDKKNGDSHVEAGDSERAAAHGKSVGWIEDSGNAKFDYYSGKRNEYIEKYQVNPRVMYSNPVYAYNTMMATFHAYANGIEVNGPGTHSVPTMWECYGTFQQLMNINIFDFALDKMMVSLLEIMFPSRDPVDQKEKDIENKDGSKAYQEAKAEAQKDNAVSSLERAIDSMSSNIEKYFNHENSSVYTSPSHQFWRAVDDVKKAFGEDGDAKILSVINERLEKYSDPVRDFLKSEFQDEANHNGTYKNGDKEVKVHFDYNDASQKDQESQKQDSADNDHQQGAAAKEESDDSKEQDEPKTKFSSDTASNDNEETGQETKTEADDENGKEKPKEDVSADPDGSAKTTDENEETEEDPESVSKDHETEEQPAGPEPTDKPQTETTENKETIRTEADGAKIYQETKAKDKLENEINKTANKIESAIKSGTTTDSKPNQYFWRAVEGIKDLFGKDGNSTVSSVIDNALKDRPDTVKGFIHNMLEENTSYKDRNSGHKIEYSYDKTDNDSDDEKEGRQKYQESKAVNMLKNVVNGMRKDVDKGLHSSENGHIDVKPTWKFWKNVDNVQKTFGSNGNAIVTSVINDVLNGKNCPDDVKGFLKSVFSDKDNVSGSYKDNGVEKTVSFDYVAETEKITAEENTVDGETPEKTAEKAPVDEEVDGETPEAPVEEAPVDEKKVDDETPEETVEKAPVDEKKVDGETPEETVEKAPVDEEVDGETPEAPVEEAPVDGEEVEKDPAKSEGKVSDEKEKTKEETLEKKTEDAPSKDEGETKKDVLAAEEAHANNMEAVQPEISRENTGEEKEAESKSAKAVNNEEPKEEKPEAKEEQKAEAKEEDRTEQEKEHELGLTKEDDVKEEPKDEEAKPFEKPGTEQTEAEPNLTGGVEQEESQIAKIEPSEADLAKGEDTPTDIETPTEGSAAVDPKVQEGTKPEDEFKTEDKNPTESNSDNESDEEEQKTEAVVAAAETEGENEHPTDNTENDDEPDEESAKAAISADGREDQEQDSKASTDRPSQEETEQSVVKDEQPNGKEPEHPTTEEAPSGESEELFGEPPEGNPEDGVEAAAASASSDGSGTEADSSKNENSIAQDIANLLDDSKPQFGIDDFLNQSIDVNGEPMTVRDAIGNIDTMPDSVAKEVANTISILGDDILSDDSAVNILSDLTITLDDISPGFMNSVMDDLNEMSMLHADDGLEDVISKFAETIFDRTDDTVDDSASISPLDLFDMQTSLFNDIEPIVDKAIDLAEAEISQGNTDQGFSIDASDLVSANTESPETSTMDTGLSSNLFDQPDNGAEMAQREMEQQLQNLASQTSTEISVPEQNEERSKADDSADQEIEKLNQSGGGVSSEDGNQNNNPETKTEQPQNSDDVSGGDVDSESLAWLVG